jgi:hypothetical protein
MDTEQIRNLEQIRAWVATRRQPVPRLLTQTSYESTALHHIDDLLAAIDELTQQKGEMTMETFDRQAVLAKAEEVLDEARSETDRENRDSLIRLAGVYIHLAGEGRDKS